MRTEFITVKMTPDALQMLRRIATYTGEKQYAVLRRLLRKEFAKHQKHMEEASPEPGQRTPTDQ
jgi:hypothetical protein